MSDGDVGAVGRDGIITLCCLTASIILTSIHSGPWGVSLPATRQTIPSPTHNKWAEISPRSQSTGRSRPRRRVWCSAAGKTSGALLIYGRWTGGRSLPRYCSGCDWLCALEGDIVTSLGEVCQQLQRTCWYEAAAFGMMVAPHGACGEPCRCVFGVLKNYFC